MTDLYECTFFNSFVKAEIKIDLMKRVIVNGMTGSKRFKRFETITFIAIDINISDENTNLNFSSDDEKDDDNRSFIDGSSKVGDQEPSFYRKFFNQTRDPAEAVLDDDGSHLDTRDLQHKIFSLEERNDVEIEESSKCA